MEITRNSKLSHAEQMLQQLRNTFIEDLPHKFEAMENLILGLQQENEFNANFDQLFRTTHSLKGSAGTYGLHVLSTICHQFEDQLKQVNGDFSRYKPAYTDYWIEYIDLLREGLDAILDNQDRFPRIDEKLVKLKHRVWDNHLSGILVTSSRAVETMCNRILEQQAVTLSIAHDGYLALGRLLRESFDFLITTNETQGMNGIALIAAVRLSRTINKSIPCLVITSGQSIHTGRGIDPDYVIVRDTGFAENLTSVIHQISARTAIARLG